MFFDDWYGIVRVLTVGTCGYLALIALVRISGKRTLSKLNAFDFVVTVALGSTLATVLLSSTVSLAEGVAALALLVGLQAAVSWTSVHSARVRELTRAEPTLVLRAGRPLRGALKRERVTVSEVESVARQHGYVRLADVGAIVLETDGTFSVLDSPPRDRSAPPPGQEAADEDADEQGQHERHP